VAQNETPGEATGDPQRAQAGPEPGAERRRPQWGQNGSALETALPQNGHPVWTGASGGSTPGTRVFGMGLMDGWGSGVAGDTGPVLGVPPAGVTPAAADDRARAWAADLVSGLPQSIQKAAAASLARPQ